PITPTYLVSQAKGKATLRNYEFKIFNYTEPE
ncbi:MAG: hypothetical protein HZB22_06155, partial [Deltaproteobacteria bacterium]|nr:hypothetical protein [Deltaproteobacteria bacterium]